jgi:hypothetical protein
MAVTRADGADFDAKMAGADLSAKVGYACKYAADGRVVLCAAASDWPAGIITEGAAADKPVTFQTSGLAKGVAGAAIAENDRVTTNSSGKLVTANASTSTMVLGVARNTVNADGEIVSVYIDRTRGA